MVSIGTNVVWMGKRLNDNSFKRAFYPFKATQRKESFFGTDKTSRISERILITMKKVSIDDLAKESGISKTTISKAVNNCFGIDYETKKEVLQIAEKFGYTRAKEETQTGVQLGIVLPDNPKYFWHLAYQGIKEESRNQGMSIKASVYNTLANEEEMLGCLEHVTEWNATILIVIAPNAENAIAKLTELAKKIPVILLTEFLDIENTFYVGADTYKDGCALGEIYLERYRNYKRILAFSTAETVAIQNRIKGFYDTVSKETVTDLHRLVIPKNTKTFSSLIAREISTRYPEGIDLILCADGVLPDVCLAVKKLKPSHKMLCLGFENPESNRPYIEAGILGALIRQDVELQARTAVRLAAEYVRTGCLPEKKVNFVGSVGERFK